ncbi:hypothetical protein PIB30_082347 [Stylosanthes scabra]|uniref:GRF-type domain-containing protein n=1 Tax=Stylosanthes scabra TaxID=79078 RepID=A0ABU6STB3_9FABA|nr:hypothetical protein [Stylosanthes scabra]
MIKNPNLKLKSSFTPNSQLPCPSPNPLALVLPLTRSRPLDVRKLIAGAVEASSEPPPVSVETRLCAAASSKAFDVCEVEFVCVYHGMIWRLISDNGMSHRTKSADSGDSSSNGERICKCGLVAQMKVSNSEANPGREYFSCPDGKCRWFRWAGPPVNCPARVVGQNRNRDAEDAQLGLRSSLLAHDRIRKIEYDCVTLKLFACVHLACVVFCLVLIMVVFFKN